MAYTTLFAFGDSLSDAGNDWIVDGHTDPVSPYYQGHFSNGLTWVEDLSNMLGLGTLKPSLAGGNDFAFGGAETGPTAIEGVNPGDLLFQVAQYTVLHPTPVGGALYTLDIGGNDIDKALDEYHAGQITPSVAGTVVAQAEANAVHAVDELFALGARNLLFYEVPDLGLAPHFRAEGPAWQNFAGALAKSFDQTVLSDLVPLEHLGLKVYDLPTYADLDLVASNPSYFAPQYGISFTNVTTPGWTGNFTSSSSGGLRPDYQDYLFFDTVHPTALAHQLTADIAYHVSSGALNADGHSDILWQNANGQVSVWEMNGTNVADGAVSPNPGPSWKAIGTGDFNDDGHSDILWQNANGQASIWEMNGNTLIGGGAVNPNPGPSWKAIGTGDFNDDGHSDILFQNASSGQVSISEMNGTSLIGGGPVSPNPGPAWKAIGTGDFNDDHLSDVLFQSTSSGQVSIWEMDGNKLIGGGPASPNPGPNWHAIGTGDFNHDGLSDILFQNASTGQVSIWEMSADKLIGGGLVGPNPGPSWHAIGTDGGSDILFQNTSGQASIWDMSGTSLIGGGPVSPSPGPSWRAVGLT